jgi:hypothetical protein
VTTKLLHPIPEACQIIGIGHTKFYEEVKRGRILLVKVGNKSLAPHSSLEAYRDLLIAEAEAARQQREAA